ncbi:hypothetical protein [Sulfurovum sp.]|uniref:hypothetical protein n=1 Tax=Sulfurovum sp. TaxID=1969726 RepID=UPI0025DF9CDC|nr:hypothetical protein [Sulfurovum sp.]
MNSKKWIKLWALPFLVVPIVGAVNYLIDPLWLHSYETPFNQKRYNHNERVQKSGYFQYATHDGQYDTLLLGSSRTTLYQQSDFKNHKVFNYACAGMMPYEYQTYLDFVNASKSMNLQHIILGLDFFASRAYKTKRDLSFLKEMKENKELYALKQYLSFDAFKYSALQLYHIVRPPKHDVPTLVGRAKNRFYTPRNTVIEEIVNPDIVEKVAHKRSDYWPGMTFSETYTEDLSRFKEKIKDYTLTVYTTPLSDPFLVKLYSNKDLRKYYFRWIKEMVGVFDSVYFFTLPSKLSKEYKNRCKDGDHYYPSSTKKIIDIIEHRSSIEKYGIFINKKNLDESLTYIENLIQHFQK